MFTDLFNLVFPNLCLVCQDSLLNFEKFLCTECFYQLPKTDHFDSPENPALKQMWGRVKIQTGGAFLNFQKENSVRILLHHLKYRGKKEIGFFFGKEMGRSFLKGKIYQEPDLILPIPLHPAKKRRRGYNQAYLIALGVAKALNKPVADKVFFRNSDSKTQTQKARYHRWENVRGIFCLNESGLIEGKKVLLIDDVFTSGATIEAACNCLEGAKPDQISFLTLAYASI